MRSNMRSSNIGNKKGPPIGGPFHLFSYIF